MEMSCHLRAPFQSCVSMTPSPVEPAYKGRDYFYRNNVIVLRLQFYLDL
jgi:hypothetical protein